MSLLKGETVHLVVHTPDASGGFVDDTNYSDSVPVSGVLVAPAGTSDLSDGIRPEGDEERITLHFPKTFRKSLRNGHVLWRGKRYKIIGDPQPYQAANVPTRWHLCAQAVRVDG